MTLAVDPSEELAPGTRVGEYLIEKRIGVGGMGIVYGAVHPVIGKRAALKVLNARYCSDQESVQRFVREAQAVNKVGHANIVDIFSIGTLPDGRSYLVMEWLRGETLMDHLERAVLPLVQTLDILIALTRALEAAHNAGVIHRDLKPDNVFLLPEDGSFRVKLLDFGIAKLETRRAPVGKTATGMTVGTPLYMSPEQAKGLAIDGRTDIYSLGIVAYGMVCRRTPFEDEASSVEVLHAHIRKPPIPPRDRGADIPPALELLILEMLAKRRDDRPDIRDVRHRLKQIKADNGSFETFSSETPVRKSAATWSRRRWAIVVGLLAMMVGSGAFIVARSPDVPTPAPAEPAVRTPLRTEAARPPPPPAPGALELLVEPATASVTIDGRAVTLAGGRARLELAAGEHVVSGTAAGHHASERTVAVTSANVTSVTLKLVKVPARPPAKKRPKDVDAVVNPFGTKR